MSTPRPTRSRVSSPYVGASANTANESQNSNAGRLERPRTFMDKWVEPPLPAPRPSFAEAGIERHGVVQNMAPLGTRPSSKMMKSVTARLESEGLGRSTTKRAAASTVTTPGESTTTPEPPANPPPSHPEARSETPQVKSATKIPEETASPIHSVPRPSVPPPQSYGQGVFALQKSPIPVATMTPQPHPISFPASTPYPPQTPTSASLTPLVVPPLPMDPDGLPSINIELTDKIVEAAVQEAVDRLKWPTAYALRTLYDDHRKNKRIVRLIEAVYNGRANEREQQEFTIIMRKKKREGKKGRTGEYYFNGDGSDPAPAQHIYSAIQAVNPPAQPYKTPYSALPPRPSTANSVAASSSQSVSASPRKDADHAHVDKKVKIEGVLPSTELNGNAGVYSTMPPQSPAPNGTSNKSTQKRVRSNSDSSSSSLSSVDEQLLGEGLISAGVSPARPVTSRLAPGSIGAGLVFGASSAQPFVSPYANADNFAALASAAENPARSQAKHQQPISTQANSSPKPNTLFSTASTTSSSLDIPSSAPNTTDKNNNNDNDNDNDTAPQRASPKPMAPAALLSQDSNSSSNSVLVVPIPAKFKNSNKYLLNGGTTVPDETVPRLKRAAREISTGQSKEESFVRGAVHGAHMVEEPESASDGADSGPPPAKRRALDRLNTKKAKPYRTRNNYEEDQLSSPSILDFRPDIAPGSLNTSRAGTPNLLARPTRKTKPVGSGLRKKSSPVKKKGGGTSAGLPRESGARSPVGNGAVNNQGDQDNNDFCSACGGNGELVCCDGCIRSFHLKCVDPPMEDDGGADSTWFCNKCQAKMDDERAWAYEHEGRIFDQLSWRLDDTNPSAFHLPKDIREYFVDVKTGTEGEYEEAAPPPPPKTTKKSAAEETNIDFFRKKDAKGNTVLCHLCHLSASAPDRMIVPCSFCGLNWHLDCLPTPLAKEPNPLHKWRCPAHVNDLLATIPEFLGPAHRFRKIKGSSVQKPLIDRGFKNNGHIEVENEETEVEEEPGFFESREFGKVYKLPAKGIILDFISKVKQQGGGYVPSRFSARAEQAQVRKNRPATRDAVTRSLQRWEEWDEIDLYKKQAVLNLTALASSTPQISEISGVNNLVRTLVTEASPAVVSLMAQGDAPTIAGSGKLSKQERMGLLVMKATIESRLAADAGDGEADDVPESAVDTSPATVDPISSDTTDEAETTLSTIDDVEPEAEP